MTSHPTTYRRPVTSRQYILMTASIVGLGFAALIAPTPHMRGGSAGAIRSSARGMETTMPVTDQEMYGRRAVSLAALGLTPEPVSDHEMYGRLGARVAPAPAEPASVSDQEMYSQRSTRTAPADEAR